MPAVTRGVDWSVVLPLPARLLAGSFVHAVDVVLPAECRIRFGEVRLLTPQRPVRASKTAAPVAALLAATAPPGSGPAAPVVVEAAPPMMIPGAAYGTAKLAEFHNVGRIAILTLELSDAVLGGIRLRPFYLKLLRESTYVALELLASTTPYVFHPGRDASPSTNRAVGMIGPLVSQAIGKGG